MPVSLQIMAVMTSSRSRDVPLGIRAVEACGRHSSASSRLQRYQVTVLAVNIGITTAEAHSMLYNQMVVLVLTFLTYMCYHMTRKPTSVVKSVLNPKVQRSC